jgi:hypothetical protein
MSCIHNRLVLEKVCWIQAPLFDIFFKFLFRNSFYFVDWDGKFDTLACMVGVGVCGAIGTIRTKNI